MDTTKKVSNFVAQVVARLKNDDAEVIALKNERKADSAIQSQIQALKSKLVDDESALEDAKESLENSIFPTEKITHNQSYVDSIARHQKNVDSMQDSLDSTKESIAYFTKLVKDKF